MNSNEWLKLARKKGVQKRIKTDDLLPLYGSVKKQFANWKRVNWDNAVVGLHIVYGWMPTIPKFKKVTKSRIEQKKVERLFNLARCKKLTADEIDELKEKLINNSVVGTSKFLHLLAPKKYAIWDKRVAKVWYSSKASPPSCYVRSKEYVKYNDALNFWLTDKGSSKKISNQISSLRKKLPHLETASDLRILELVLFHAKK